MFFMSIIFCKFLSFFFKFFDFLTFFIKDHKDSLNCLIGINNSENLVIFKNSKNF